MGPFLGLLACEILAVTVTKIYQNVLAIFVAINIEKEVLGP